MLNRTTSDRMEAHLFVNIFLFSLILTGQNTVERVVLLLHIEHEVNL
jgi:hypothetical protein